MAYLPREQRRVAIIDAAVRVARRSGLSAVTARTVASELAGSPGLIHQHFASMPDLQAAAWESYVAGQAATFADAVAHGADPLHDFFANHVDAEHASELGLWADAWAHALRTPAFAVAFTQSLDIVVEALLAAAPDMHPDEARRSTLLAIALAGMQRIAPGSYTPETVSRILGLSEHELSEHELVDRGSDATTS